MLTGIMAILSAICSVIAKIISFVPWWVWVCIAIFFLGGWVFYGGSCRDFCCHHTPRPREQKWDQLTVLGVSTGASMECSLGRRERRIKTVNLAHIAAPSDSPLKEESRASLERLAGSAIRIPHIGILNRPPQDSTKPVSAMPNEETQVKCDVCDGTGKILDICEVGCFFCQKDPKCPECHGTGKMNLSYGIIEQCQAAISDHMDYDGCEKCQELGGPCPVLAQQLRDIIATNLKKPVTIDCFGCGGTGKYSTEPLESKVFVGEVYSLYGQCLNTEQVRLGMAKLMPDAPKAWRAFENEAKRNNRGLWKKVSVPKHK